MNQNYNEIFSKAIREILNPCKLSDNHEPLGLLRDNIENYSIWKKWHNKSIEEIVTFDAMEKADRKAPIGPEFRTWTIYMRQVWRRINDTIIWLMFGDERHIVKRLCLYQKKGLLTDSNLNFAIEALNLINSDAHSMAILNDATSCADIGDITFISERTHSFGFIELKGGKVNEEIMEMKENRNDKEFQILYNRFIERYGKHGLKQFKRFERQEMRCTQAVELIRKEKGIDPVTSWFTEIQEIKCDIEYYDDELMELLDRLFNNKKEQIILIDNCLWIYANIDSKLSFNKISDSFKTLLIQKEPRLRQYLEAKWPQWDVGNIAIINQGLNLPISRPIYLRNIDLKYINEIIVGNLMFKLQLYFDWDKFGELLNKTGIELSWSTNRQARREKSKPNNLRSSVIVYGKLPQLRWNDVFSTITGASLIRILFDGIRPQTMAKQFLESFSILREKANKEKPTK
jgi:hypothetical protein